MRQDEQAKRQRPGRPDGSDMPLAVIGISVSAQSLPSFRTILADLDEPTGAVYLIALHQNEGLDVPAVLEALEGLSALKVSIARDGEAMAPDHIYVCGSDDLITIEDGHMRVRPAAEPIGHRGTVDTLLISLAEHAHEHAVVVILSGLGSDGTAGVTATKNFGGLSIAELGPDKQPPGNGAGPSGAVDLHLPADAIAAQIRRYVSSLGQAQAADEEVPSALEAHLTQITTIMRNVTGHDFHGYKRGTLTRRVQRRMQVLQIETVEAYAERLRADRDEVQNLLQDLLIGVTQFFRDPAEFEVLEAEMPRLFEGKGAEDRLRVWVLGCATGEEAYSIAILLREYMARLDHPPEVQIFATDLDARALGIARAGRYSASVATHFRPDRLARWFVREGDTYCVSRELSEMCIFSPHNVVKDAPFSRIDILSCRNLLIYLTSELQDRIMPILHFALRPGGVLFLGSSENVTRHGRLFAAVERKNRVFRRLETAARVIPDVPLSLRAWAGDPVASAQGLMLSPARLGDAISRQAEAVAERYAPAYVVVDTHGDVLQFSGRMGQYFKPAPGAASLNLMSLVHRDLRLDVRAALQSAVAGGNRIEVPGVLVRHEDRTNAVNIIIEPLGAGDITSLVVLFQDMGLMAEGWLAKSARLNGDEHVQRLETDLPVTRHRLQATIDEL
ncbi:CheR family methyltransferase [Paracoccus benzoatiresistens]|uniref:protein-glutamate O-methyltransferase n=1 Tax=Paracoccus benzoatiresistens TaxID=2997341 RepID=A0ABT4J7W3_9RHOB|nr:CheR family methyltransferase [Paracoccus sp. EF6]MCZ0963167.1 hypothetical protein [Paracoccus sp. EF6]